MLHDTVLRGFTSSEEEAMKESEVLQRMFPMIMTMFRTRTQLSQTAELAFSPQYSTSSWKGLQGQKHLRKVFSVAKKVQI